MLPRPRVRTVDSKKEVAVPWADRYQRFTRLMEQAVIIWLQACGNVDKVAATPPKYPRKPGIPAKQPL